MTSDGTAATQWRLEEGHVLRGEVVGIPAGQTVSFKVVATLPSGFGPSEYLGGDASGFFGLASWSPVDSSHRFELRGLYPGAVYTLGLFDYDEGESPFRKPFPEYALQSRCKALSCLPDSDRVVLHWKPMTTIELRVIDEVTGATISLCSVQSRAPEMRFCLGSHVGRKLSPSGLVVIENVPAFDAAVDLHVSAPGYRARAVPVEPCAPGGTVHLGTVALQPFERAAVRVVDGATGVAVAGAHVYAMAVGDEPQLLGTRPAIATTDERGTAAVQLQRSSRHSFSVRCDGYAERVLEGVPGAAGTSDGEPIVVALRRGGGAEVRVTGGRANGRAGGCVLASPISGDAATGASIRRSNRLADLRLRIARTDENGLAVFQDLVPGEYEFLAVPEEPPPAVLFRHVGGRRGGAALPPAAGAVRAIVEEGVTATVTLGSKGSFLLRGKVRLGGETLRGARVTLFDPDRYPGKLFRILQGSAELASIWTDENGAYELTSSIGGDHVVIVQSSRCMQAFEARVTLREGAQELDMEIAGSMVEGRIVDRGGAPVPDQVVTVTAASGVSVRAASWGLVPTHARVTSGADGRFRLVGITPWVAFRVQCGSSGDLRGWQRATSGEYKLAEGETQRDVQLVVSPSKAPESPSSDTPSAPQVRAPR